MQWTICLGNPITSSQKTKRDIRQTRKEIYGIDQPGNTHQYPCIFFLKSSLFLRSERQGSFANSGARIFPLVVYFRIFCLQGYGAASFRQPVRYTPEEAKKSRASRTGFVYRFPPKRSERNSLLIQVTRTL